MICYYIANENKQQLWLDYFQIQIQLDWAGKIMWRKTLYNPDLI